MATKEELIEVLDEWNFWSRKQPIGKPRVNYVERIEKGLKTGQIVIISGIRRGGKSTLIKQVINRLIENKIEPRQTLFINFEESRFERSVKFLNELYDAYMELIHEGGKPFIFLDEIQTVKGWERFVRSLHEREAATILVSGSSSSIIKGDLATVLTGRHVDVKVDPLNFREFLEFKGITITDKFSAISKKTVIRKLLREYLEFGGMPKVIESDEKIWLLTTYFNDIIIRDVAKVRKIRKVSKLESIAKFYLTNFTSEVSYRKMARSLGVSLDTVERYTRFLKQAYMISIVNRFSYSLHEQESRAKKIFATDNGLRNAVSFKTTKDFGRMYENLVYNTLLGRGYETYYLKNAAECDFIAKIKGKTRAIQITYELNETNKEREFEGLVMAMKKLKLKQGLIITDDLSKEEKIGDKKIIYKPLWQWLLFDE
jgi:predicted AAA+ superfamily ATPase